MWNHPFPCAQSLSGPTSLSGSLSLQSNTLSSPNHHHPFFKHVTTIAIYFFGPRKMVNTMVFTGLLAMVHQLLTYA